MQKSLPNWELGVQPFRGELVPQDPKDEPASVLLERIQAERAQTATKPKRTRAQGRPSSPRSIGPSHPRRHG